MDEGQAVVGRRAELQAATELLERSRGGLAALLLTGAPGIGKSTVWRRGRELAAATGFTVLTARPAAAEARLSHAGLSDLLGGAGEDLLAALPRVQRRALEVAFLRRGVERAVVEARAVATAALSVLRALAADAPVLIAVDDAQWLDAPSASALAYAVRRLDDAPVAVLAAIRIEDRRPHTFADAIAAERRVEATLGPLSVASLHAVIRRELGAAPPRPTLVKIAAATGGNAFDAIEVARELERLGPAAAAAGPLPVPAATRELLHARLQRLPPRARSALLAASCLASPHVDLVDERALAAAEEAGVVHVGADGRIDFAHPLLAAAVYESAPVARRRAAHRALARRVTDPEERARHLALAASRRDGSAAVELDRAAQLARARGAPAAAAELAELALRISPASEEGARLLAAAACHFDSGDLDRARALLDGAVERAPHGSQRAAALRLLGHLEARRSSFTAAYELAAAALDEAGDDDALAAGLELDVAFFGASLGDFARAAPHARAAVAAAERVGAEAVLAPALAALTMMEFLCGRGLDAAALDRALALDDPLAPLPFMLRPRFIAGLLLLWTGSVSDGLEALDAVRLEALEQGREADVSLVGMYVVWACAWRGDLERARRVADETVRIATLLDDRMALALALSARAFVGAHAGGADAVREDADEALARFRQLGWQAGLIWPLWALGLLELSGGDPAAAYAALEPLAAVVAAMGTTDPVLCVFVPEAVQALVELGRVDEARALLEPFETQARALDRGWALAASARCRALLHAAGGELDAARAALDEALARHDGELPLERARTLLELGRLERRRRRKRLARVALDDAVAAFERAGADRWAERARHELARVATRRAPATLTPTEERIARLAAEGLSNRQIGERAFVAVGTVEANLKRAYRKLGITSRAQLARALDERAAEPIS
ncbi:MAG TPA: AAA family ATPase [Gaiellaceae bacterium]|nr:AAA family ATPase [Gaiellaceae bacterium]